MAGANIDRNVYSGSSLVDGWANRPSNGDNIFEGANAIRATRGDLRAALAEEHVISSEDLAIGEHVEGSAKCFVIDDENPGGITDSSRGRMRFNESSRALDISNGDSWIPLGNFFPGMISMSAVVPNPAVDGWALCDGRLVTESEANGLYRRLITRLVNSTAVSVTLPDLRNQFVRGASAPRSGEVDPPATRAVLTSQEHAFENHTHLMDHTHGASITAGGDTGNGRTGTGTWIEGAFTSPVNDGAHTHTFTAVRTAGTRHGAGLGTANARDNPDPSVGTTTTTGSVHSHVIERYHGLTKEAGNAANPTYGVPANEYNTDPNETRPDNIALYYVIKL